MTDSGRRQEWKATLILLGVVVLLMAGTALQLLRQFHTFDWELLGVVLLISTIFGVGVFVLGERSEGAGGEKTGQEPAPPAEGAMGLLKVERKGVSRQCPYCRDETPADPRTCLHCEASYHGECWEEAGGCVTLGCAGRRRAREAERG